MGIDDAPVELLNLVRRQKVVPVLIQAGKEEVHQAQTSHLWGKNSNLLMIMEFFPGPILTQLVIMRYKKNYRSKLFSYVMIHLN